MAPAPRTMNLRRNLMRRSTKYDVSGAALQAPKPVKRHVFKWVMGFAGVPYHHALATDCAAAVGFEYFRPLFARKLRVAQSMFHSGRT
jgi:hypothetical protein